MKIILTGGGTMGSVIPLLAIREKILEMNVEAEFLWIGTKTGLEQYVVRREDIPYYSVRSGKWRRYFSLRNILAPLEIMLGIIQSILIIKKFKPDIVLSAGGFVCVPVIWAANLMRKKSVVHQQDIKTGLANKLMAKKATKITVAFEKSKADFPEEKTVVIGNPVRSKILQGDREHAIQSFGLEKDLPTLLVMGGSLGAEKINELIVNAATELIDFCQIIHVTGRGNVVEWLDRHKFYEKGQRYHIYEYFTDELADAYAAADLVVSRAGLSTLTELAALKKPTILIPIPNNQQEDNAKFFEKQNAVIILEQDKMNADEFVRFVSGLFNNSASLENLSQQIGQIMKPDAAEKYVQLVQEMVKEERV